MSKLIGRASVIVAHYENVRRVAPDERRLGAALEGFIGAIVPELARGEDGVYVHFEKQGEYGRALNLFGVETRKGVFFTLQGDKDETGEPWTEEGVRRRALKGDLGLLRNPSAWTNAFFAGVARSRLVWWGSPALWSKCDREGAGAARLAWEALAGHGRPWEWEFQLRDVALWYVGENQAMNPASRMSGVRDEWCREVRHRALKVFSSIWTPPGDFPLEVLRDRGEARPLQAIAYHLMEAPMGPGLRPEAAARVVGSDRREMVRALDGYFEHNPGAKKWPVNKAKPWEITEIRSGGTMAHH